MILLIIMLISIKVVGAVSVIPDPAYVEVLVGGQNNSTIIVTVGPGGYRVGFDVASASKDAVSALLSGPYDENSNPLEGFDSTSIGDEGNLTLLTLSGGTYYYVLTIVTDEGVTVGRDYTISVYVYGTERGEEEVRFNIDIDVIAGTVIPEPFTAVLVGIGLLVLLRPRT